MCTDIVWFVELLSMMLCYVWDFFFFKQKTAYEMRISDWSSDVCSSDLPDRHRRRDTPAPLIDRVAPGNILIMPHALDPGADMLGEHRIHVRGDALVVIGAVAERGTGEGDRKSTRLNSSH